MVTASDCPKAASSRRTPQKTAVGVHRFFVIMRASDGRIGSRGSVVMPTAWYHRLPWSIVGIAVLLTAIGCLGIARAEELAGGGTRILQRQILFSLIAVVAAVAVAVPHYRILGRYSYGVYFLTLVLLGTVFLFPPVNFAHRWIWIGPLSLQPSELAKVATVLALARYLMHRDDHRRLLGLLMPLVIAVVPVMLILPEPDLGTSMVFLPVLFAVLYTAGARGRDLLGMIIVGLLLVPLLWSQMSREQRSRVTAFFDQPSADDRPGDDGYHLYQARRVRALGGVWGSWMTGQRTDDLAVYRLPHAHSDFIFAVLGERFGLPGLGLVLALYTLLVARILAVAAATREPFGRLVASGVAALFAVETFINTGMTVGLLPITGLSLPLMSSGGSGLVAHAVALGLVVNIGVRPGYEVAPEPFRYR